MHQVLQTFFKEIIFEIYQIRLDDDLLFQNPPKKDLGDITLSVFSLAKLLKKSPQVIAQEISEKVGYTDNDYVRSITSDGGYINIFLQDTYFNHLFGDYLSSGDTLTDLYDTSDKCIYIDYIGANVGKPLHIGHICTPAQGQVFINLFRKLGYKVIADSHLGDWGIIFGKLIVAFEKYGDEQKLQENAVDHLLELYVQISSDSESDETLDQQFRDAFKKLSGGEQKYKDIWANFTRSSIETMNSVLGRLFVSPDYDIGESFYEGLGLEKMQDYPDLTYDMQSIVEELLEKNIATQNEDGSVGVVFSEESKISSCILRKRDGTHGYLASDLASVKYRVENWNPQKIIYFVDVRQQLHLRQVFEISKKAGWLSSDTEITHAHNGFISLKDGPMSTRKGKIIRLDHLLDEGEKRAESILREKRNDFTDTQVQELSKIISVGAIKYGYLQKGRESDVIFDWDEFMSFEGKSGPYIQYAYVRAKKIIEKTGVSKDACGDMYISHEKEKNLLREILTFQEAITGTLKHYHSHILCQYVYDLTKAFSAFYSDVPVVQESDENKKNTRILLTKEFIKVIEQSMEILGIPLPEYM